MRIILHIGTHKTGTSALQLWLHRQRGALRDAGWLYPRAFQYHDHSHHHLYHALADNERTAEAAQKLQEEIGLAPRPVETVLISSELLEKVVADPVRLPNLLSFFARLNAQVEVVCFVRPQAAIVDSIFKQWVKDTRVQYRKLPADMIRMQRAHLAYSKYLDQWNALEPVYSVRIGSYPATQGQDIFAKFAMLCGLPNPGQPPASGIANPSIDGDCLRLKYAVNTLGLEVDMNAEILTFLRANFANQPRMTLFRSAEEAEAFQNEFAEDNSRIFSEYAQGDSMPMAPFNGTLFTPAEPEMVARAVAMLCDENPRIGEFVVARMWNQLDLTPPASAMGPGPLKPAPPVSAQQGGDG